MSWRPRTAMLATASAGRSSEKGIAGAERQFLEPLLGVVRIGRRRVLLEGGHCFVRRPELRHVGDRGGEPQGDDPLPLEPGTRGGLLLDHRGLRELTWNRLDGGDEPARSDDRDGSGTVHGRHRGGHPLAPPRRREGHGRVRGDRLLL